MNQSAVAVRDLLEAGAHYGHLSRLLNPKARSFVYGQRNGISIINLQKTVDYVKKACAFIQETTAGGGHILFVGTKRQSQELVKEHAVRCNQYYMNHRWLGGTLTNHPTLRKSIHKLRKLEKMSQDGTYEKLTKKEALNLDRLRLKLDANLAGIKDMPGMPQALFLTDILKERTALLEAHKLGIPVVGIVDTNGDPRDVEYPIPGNDDSLKSLSLFISTIADAALQGTAEHKQRSAAAAQAGESTRSKAPRGPKTTRSTSSTFQSKEGRTVKVEKVSREGEAASHKEPAAQKKPSAPKKSLSSKEASAPKETPVKEKKPVSTEKKSSVLKKKATTSSKKDPSKEEDSPNKPLTSPEESEPLQKKT